MSALVPDAVDHQPYYCEENVWRLGTHPALAGRRRWVVFISNPGRTCALWAQRVAPPNEPVIWDYHVILCAESHLGQMDVFDLDSRCPFPCSLDTYLDQTFPLGESVPREFAPRFRTIEADRFLRVFASDRSHMRDARGHYARPPPPWPPPRSPAATMNLFAFVDMTTDFEGVISGRYGLRAALEDAYTLATSEAKR